MIRFAGVYFALCVFVLFTTVSCGGGSDGSGAGGNSITVKKARAVTATEKQLLTSDNGFGFNLFKAAVASDKDKNVFISPLSVAMALGMVYNGANGNTQQQMQTVLQLNGLTLQQVNESYKSLIDLLGGLDPKVKFSLANSIWYKQGFEVEKQFTDLNKEYFNAEVTTLDFSDPSAAATINNWVSDKTNGKITSIVDQQAIAGMVMYLVNAIYFKGDWSIKFDKANTKDDSFALPDGTTKSCSMMNRADYFDYFENTDLQAVDLPYGTGDYSMTVILPKPGKDIDTLVSNFTQDNWDQWMQQFGESYVALSLPKFKIEYQKELSAILKGLGMPDAFDAGKADFTNINKNGGLLISEVMHKSFVEVNEEGTEAAAVTGIGMVTSMPMPHLMQVNRPFVFAIRERKSGTILFIGKITDPTQQG